MCLYKSLLGGGGRLNIGNRVGFCFFFFLTCFFTSLSFTLLSISFGLFSCKSTCFSLSFRQGCVSRFVPSSWRPDPMCGEREFPRILASGMRQLSLCEVWSSPKLTLSLPLLETLHYLCFPCSQVMDHNVHDLALDSLRLFHASLPFTLGLSHTGCLSVPPRLHGP